METFIVTGFTSKRRIALDRLDDDDIQIYAQPSNGPVAWGFRHDDGAIYDCISPEAHADCEGEYTVPLYTAPQRPWVGLTEDEAFACKGRDYFETYKAIETKLKEKNNG